MPNAKSQKKKNALSQIFSLYLYQGSVRNLAGPCISVFDIWTHVNLDFKIGSFILVSKIGYLVLHGGFMVKICKKIRGDFQSWKLTRTQIKKS